MVENRDTKILEAILFASGEPVLEEDLKQKRKIFLILDVLIVVIHKNLNGKVEDISIV